jgi:hypothetical protein
VCDEQLRPRHIDFAGCDESESGQRFLDSSDPRLIRHVASCETAGGDGSSLEWDTYPQPAGKDKKLSQGFGDRVPDRRAIRARFPSLDLLENNRHKPHRVVPDYYRRPVGRGKFCGRCSVRGTDPKTGRTVYRRINCGSWTCCYCGPRRARTARAAIRNRAESLNLKYFLTLTLDPKKLEHPKFAVPHLRLCFNKFREYLKRKYGVAPSFISVLEFTKAGVPHLHVLLDRYIEQRWVSSVWDKLGGGRIVFIKQVTVQKVSRYLSKYLTKELLLSAPKGTRRITCARSIKLFPKFDSDIAWELLKSSIWQMLAECRGRDYQLQPNLYEFISIEFDEEAYLKAFQLHNKWTDKPEDENDEKGKQSESIRLYPESAFNQRRRLCR